MIDLIVMVLTMITRFTMITAFLYSHFSDDRLPYIELMAIYFFKELGISFRPECTNQSIDGKRKETKAE